MDKPILATGIRELPKIAIVLGTGGIKAMAALALFEFFEEQKIPIDLLVGCSGGALACATIGMGQRPSQVREMGLAKLEKKLFTKINYKSLMGIFSSKMGTFDKRSGILNPERYQNALREYFGDIKLEQMRPRTLIQTTDVETGEGVVLSRGLAADAVYASCAFFPAFPPIKIDGRYLGDGIYSAPVPVVEAIKRNVDVIIALDFKEKVRTEPKGFFSCFYRHIDNTMRTLTRSQMLLSIGMHHHEIVIVEVDFDHSINPWDVHELPSIIEAGEVAVKKQKNAILSAIASFTKSSPQPENRPDKNPTEKRAEKKNEGVKDSANQNSGFRRTVAINPDDDEDRPKPGRTGS